MVRESLEFSFVMFSCAGRLCGTQTYEGVQYGQKPEATENRSQPSTGILRGLGCVSSLRTAHPTPPSPARRCYILTRDGVSRLLPVLTAVNCTWALTRSCQVRKVRRIFDHIASRLAITGNRLPIALQNRRGRLSLEDGLWQGTQNSRRKSKNKV